jgi:selenide,water dikinase
LRLRRAIRDLETVSKDPRYPLIFDPQTVGGLLASVPGDRASDCVGELHGLGYHRASVIGQVLPESNALESITLVS